MTSRNYPYKAWWIDPNQRPVQVTLTHPVSGTTNMDVTASGKVRCVDELFGTRDMALSAALAKVQGHLAEIKRVADRLQAQHRRLCAHIKEQHA